MRSSKIVFFAKELFTYVYMHICVHTYEELFFKNMISELGIGIAASIFGLALNTFWKRTLQF